MKLIMAVSRDGYVTRTKDDDMDWTGKTDKAVFRLLTRVGGALAHGSGTVLPHLPGREVYRLSRKPVQPYEADGPVFRDLLWFQERHRNGWLVGGQTIAIEALKMGLIDQAFICQSDRRCHPDEGGEPCRLYDYIHLRGINPPFYSDGDVTIGDVRVCTWRKVEDFYR